VRKWLKVEPEMQNSPVDRNDYKNLKKRKQKDLLEFEGIGAETLIN
jgi:hypothetical protein